MADFNVSIRSSYRDIGRLLLDLSPGDYDVADDRRITRWRNSAPPAWSPGGARFADATFETHDQRPFVGTNGAVLFRAAQRTQLLTSCAGGNESWTIGFELSAVGEPSVRQAIVSYSSSDFAIWNIRSAQYGFESSVGYQGVAGSMTIGKYIFAADGINAATLYRDNAPVVTGIVDDFRASSVAIGGDFGSSFLDGELRSCRAWRRVLAPKEIDFAYASFGDDDVSSGVSGDPRAPMRIKSWVDGTGDLSLRQARRVNPVVGRHQRFRCAQLPGGAPAIVQIACETDGDVLDDSELGSDLYTLSTIERASSSDPQVTQDTGWSSIFDVRITAPGHYTFLLARENHGAVYVHLDAEDA